MRGYKENEFSSFEDKSEEDFNLAEHLRRYLRYWYLFPIFIGLTFTLAYYYLQVTPPVYKASTTLLIKDEKKGARLGGASEILGELSQFSGNKLLENEIQIISSRQLMEQVVKELKLDINYTTKNGLKTVQLYKKSPVEIVPELIHPFGYETPLKIQVLNDKTFKINDENDILTFGKNYQNNWGVFTVNYNPEGDSTVTDVYVRFLSTRSTTSDALRRLVVTQSNRLSTVLTLEFEDTSPQRGIDVLNKLLDVYVTSSLKDKNTEASNTLAFIEERLALITNELGDVEQDVASYKTQRGLTDIGAESQLYLQNIQENESQLNEINLQIRVLESVENYIRTAGDGAVAPATYMINDPVLISLLNKFNELNLQREKYLRTTQPGNPLVETVNTQLATTRQAISDVVQNLKRGLDLTRQNLQGINQRFSAGLRSIPQKEREFVGIKRQQTIKENLYLYLLEKREETALAYASTVTDSRVVDPPTASMGPVKPKKGVIALGALLAGIALPVLLINFLFMINNTVQNKEEVEKLAGTSVLGEIGRLKSSKNAGDEIIKATSRSAVAEQFRALRTNLQYLGDGNGRIILFTSSIGGEGKTFVSTNLAASLAYSDKKVILIGADLRKPTLHYRLKIHNNKGVTNYLIGQTNLNDLIQPSGVNELFHVMAAGPLPPNPSELLGNGRMPQLIKELKEIYDYVLIDTSPYGLVTDAALISEYVDATLYIVRHNYTLREHLKSIGQLQRQKRFKNLTVVFNAVNYGSGYGYHYGYGGYGYGYYSEDKDKKPRSFAQRLLTKKV